jgi:hypothetical protein
MKIEVRKIVTSPDARALIERMDGLTREGLLNEAREAKKELGGVL